jgi:tetratricopeptide (TPR) repeat protein/predicted Ser/Thr protein kinase
MTPARWQQIDDLLQKVIDLSAAERTALLDEVCRRDAELREQVESLISFQQSAQSFLETPAIEEAAYLLCDDDADSMEGLVLGRYRIGAPLGAGGMGRVYLAEDTNLDIKVAIKFLPWYLEADKLAKERLIREAKAAAQLDHPNICSVYEVKEEVDHSFIVMQFVAGETLADRIKAAPIDLNQTLDIVIQVVEALTESHSRGIVHRDIKPGNIMITPRGQVRVLDFGLAKTIGPTPEMRALADGLGILSRPGDRSGTPPYMSPEQANEGIIDARADLFAVGVILYECVAGERPFVGATGDEILERVSNFDPPPPATFNQQIPASLNTLILKALAKDPRARHQSAAELLADLRSVKAALEAPAKTVNRPTIGEWIWSAFARNIRRRWVQVTAGAAALALAYVVYLMIAANLPHRPPAEALRLYSLGIVALHNGAYYDATKSLNQAIAADDKFALAHARLAEAYTELDYSDKAKDEIIRAESLARELSLRQSDSIYLKAVANTVLRDFPPAIESFKLLAQQAPAQETANVYLDLGRAYEKNDQLEEAKENYQKATKLAPDEAAAFLRLGVACGQSQDYACAYEAFQKAESLYQALVKQEGVAEVCYQRGFLLMDQKKLSEAGAQLDTALQMARSTGNLYQQIRALQALSNLAAHEGHIEQAKQKAADAIQLARDNDIENQVTRGLIWLGNALLLRGDYNEAEKYYQQALELAQRDRMQLDEAWARRQLGSLRSLQHNTQGALNYLEPALAFFQQRSYRYWTSLTLILLGRTQRDEGDYPAALNTFNELLQLAEQLGDQAQAAKAHLDIGAVFSYQERYPEALQDFDEGYSIFKALRAEVYLAYAAQSRATVLWQLGREEEAQAALDEAISIAEKADRPQKTYKQLLADIHLTESLLSLSELHLQKAKVESQKALELAPENYQALIIQAKDALALAQARAGIVRTSRLLCEEAVNIANPLNDPQLSNAALLACAEAMLDAGESQRSLETALLAQESFARFGKKDSEWRAWLIAAEASRRLSKTDAAHEYALNAANRLSEVEQKWGSEAYNGYLTRSDITHFRKQLDQLLNH